MSRQFKVITTIIFMQVITLDKIIFHNEPEPSILLLMLQNQVYLMLMNQNQAYSCLIVAELGSFYYSQIVY